MALVLALWIIKGFGWAWSCSCVAFIFPTPKISAQKQPATDRVPKIRPCNKGDWGGMTSASISCDHLSHQLPIRFDAFRVSTALDRTVNQTQIVYPSNLRRQSEQHNLTVRRSLTVNSISSESSRERGSNEPALESRAPELVN